MHFKTMRLTTIHNGPKRTISTSGGFELLQMVSEPNTGRCASVDVGPPRGWIVRSHVGWRGERSISYKGVETSPLMIVLRALPCRSINRFDWLFSFLFLFVSLGDNGAN